MTTNSLVKVKSYHNLDYTMGNKTLGKGRGGMGEGRKEGKRGGGQEMEKEQKVKRVGNTTIVGK